MCQCFIRTGSVSLDNLLTFLVLLTAQGTAFDKIAFNFVSATARLIFLATILYLCQNTLFS